MNRKKLLPGVLVMFIALALINSADAQSWGPRSLEELKQETLRRASKNLGPITGVITEDAERAMADFDRLDQDRWAEVWVRNGNDYMARAMEISGDEARELYYNAWRNFNVGRWPTERHSDGKRESYESGLQAFNEYGKLLDPPVETVHIPFEGSELVAYLRIPTSEGPVPLIIGINGLDSRKEDVIAGADRYIANGVGVFAMDMPGTGQSPVLIDVGSERVFSTALDYLATREDVDADRIGIQGRSWSGYWAALVAYLEPDRIQGAAIHGVGVHGYYQPEWQEHAILSEEYLFDLFPARATVYDTKTMEEFLAYGPRLSLVERGLIDQPSAPMLLVNGELDSQQPIADLYLMMRNGDPKQAWVNPVGGHMGRSEEWPMGRILSQVVEPWLMRQVGVEPKLR
ncbi:MAG: alpha/beta hydrolase [Arenicellaceae bacterium]|nr:alpha/beta hydrolase [Arenicellaceae bacterium]